MVIVDVVTDFIVPDFVLKQLPTNSYDFLRACVTQISLPLFGHSTISDTSLYEMCLNKQLIGYGTQLCVIDNVAYNVVNLIETPLTATKFHAYYINPIKPKSTHVTGPMYIVRKPIIKLVANAAICEGVLCGFNTYKIQKFTYCFNESCPFSKIQFSAAYLSCGDVQLSHEDCNIKKRVPIVNAFNMISKSFRCTQSLLEQ